MTEAAVAEAPVKGKKNTQSTKPGEPAPKAKKVKVERVMFPGLNPDAEGKPTTRLKEWPKEWDPKVHKQLKRSHFEDETPLLERRIKEHEDRIAELRKEITDIKAGGGKAKGKMKSVRRAIERFAELKSDLEKDGVDTSEIMRMFQEAMSGQVTPEEKKEGAAV